MVVQLKVSPPEIHAFPLQLEILAIALWNSLEENDLQTTKCILGEVLESGRIRTVSIEAQRLLIKLDLTEQCGFDKQTAKVLENPDRILSHIKERFTSNPSCAQKLENS